MTRSQADNWSIMRSLAFLAATFAITFASLMPFAALAAAVPGQPIVFCSAEGIHTIAVGMDGEHGGSKGLAGVKCAACLLVAPAALPDAPVVAPLSAEIAHPAQIFVAINDRPRPPARAPPRPPSTAPPPS